MKTHGYNRTVTLNEERKSHIYGAEWHWGFSKSFFCEAFSPPLHISIKKSLYSACLQQEVKQVLSTQLPDNHSVLITEQACLFNYPNNHNWATSKFLMSLTSTIQLQINTQLKKKNKKNTWNKWQLEMAESLYVLDTTINLSFAICYLVLFDSVVGIKKKSFCIQTYLQNVNIKCVTIYI